MSLYPFAGAHAVQSVAFAFEWMQPLSEDDFGRVLALQHKLLAALPNVARHPALTLNMAGGVPTTAQGTGSVVFSRPPSSGAAAPSRVLEISRDKCVGQINEYTRWKPVWEEVLGWFKSVAPAIVETHPVKHIGLQYNDVFYWRATPETLDLRTVFRTESPLLPSHVFDLKDLWHSHHGYFVKQNEPREHRLLENVNVNLMDELGQRSILISTMHRAEFATPLFSTEDLFPVMTELIPVLHSRNKDALGNLLAEDVARSIKLFAEEDRR
ncbi:MAG: hypothetical protein ROZ64_04440 [Burkholderiaceae bacterium]|jgi:uncharacterized protein (TIGR04255 family)|nr:hypothetical protein [Burkholderiaceae bacterium]